MKSKKVTQLLKTRNFSFSSRKSGIPWPGFSMPTTIVASFFLMSVQSVIGLGVTWLLLSGTPISGIESQFADLLDYTVIRVDDIIQAVMSNLRQSCTTGLLQIWLELIESIIQGLRDILSNVNSALESEIDNPSDLYDRVSNRAVDIETRIGYLLTIYRSIEVDLNIPIEATNLIPQESESDTYEMYVAAILALNQNLGN